jgi:hypothetical protein
MYVPIFDLAALAMSVLALKRLLGHLGEDRGPAGAGLAIAVGGASLALAAPYMLPGTFPVPYMKSVASTEILGRGELVDSGRAYLRRPPEPASPLWADGRATVLPAAREGRDWVFRAGLEGRGTPGSGEALLGVLHYPGLQTVEVLVDGRKAEPSLSTFWLAGPPPADGGTAGTGPAADGDLASAVGQAPDAAPVVAARPAPDEAEAADDAAVPDQGIARSGNTGPAGNDSASTAPSFHGLRLSGLPDSGAIEARVRFTGWTSCNIGSLAAALALVLLWASGHAGAGARHESEPSGPDPVRTPASQPPAPPGDGSPEGGL